MAKMTKNATTGKYELNITPSTSAQTKTLNTSGKYCDADIDIKISGMPSGSVTPSVDSLVTPSVVVSGSASGFTAASSATSYYVTVSGSPTNGSVKAKETRTAGYVTAGNSTSDASTITPGITGSGSKVYIPAATYGTSNSGTLQTTVTPSTSDQYVNITTGYTSAKYIKIDAVPTFDWASVSSNWGTSNGAVTNISEKFSIKSLIFTSSASASTSCRRLFANSETTYFIPLAASDTYIQLGTTSGATSTAKKYNLYNKGIVKIVVVNSPSTQTRTITMYYRSSITSTGWTQQDTLSVSYSSGQPGVYVYNYSGTGKSFVAEIYYNE